MSLWHYKDLGGFGSGKAPEGSSVRVRLCEALFRPFQAVTHFTVVFGGFWRVEGREAFLTWRIQRHKLALS